MKEYLTDLLQGLPPGLLVKVAVISAITFVGTLVAIPFVLVRLPENYFDVRVRRTWMEGHHPALRIVSRAFKNIAGIVFLLAGISMLVLPGQGVLTILIGLSLVDFPGKQRLEARIIGHPRVLRTVNALREKFGKPPFVIERDHEM